MDKKGSSLDLIIWIIIGFVVILFFAVFMYGFNEVTEKVREIPAVETTYISLNISDAADQTFGEANRGLGVLRWTALGMFIAFAISIFVSAYVTKHHPVFIIFHVVITIVAIIFSVFISNTYEDLLQNQLLGGMLQSFTGTNFLMLHLPTFVTIVGLGAAIFMFAGIMMDREQGGSPI